MKITEEKGITLVYLIITIIVLLILISIGYTSGKQTLDYSKYYSFEDELRVLQSKVNELNNDNKTDIGQQLTVEQKSFLNTKEISDIIYAGKTQDEKIEIQKGFRYCSSNYINEQLELGNVKYNYFINVEYRYVICTKGVKYKNKTYYMINQFDDGIYNVEYNNKNSQTGEFQVNCIKENDRWRIEVSNIEYEGYVDNWEIKYREAGGNWKMANSTVFYVTKSGNYYVQVSKGEINLGTKLISALDEVNDLNELNEVNEI